MASVIISTTDPESAIEAALKGGLPLAEGETPPIEPEVTPDVTPEVKPKAEAKPKPIDPSTIVVTGPAITRSAPKPGDKPPSIETTVEPAAETKPVTRDYPKPSKATIERQERTVPVMDQVSGLRAGLGHKHREVPGLLLHPACLRLGRATGQPYLTRAKVDEK